MGCGSSASIPQDPNKFPSHLLFQLTSIIIKTVSLQRHDEMSKEHVFQIKLEAYRSGYQRRILSAGVNVRCRELMHFFFAARKWTF